MDMDNPLLFIIVPGSSSRKSKSNKERSMRTTRIGRGGGGGGGGGGRRRRRKEKDNNDNTRYLTSKSYHYKYIIGLVTYLNHELQNLEDHFLSQFLYLR